MFGDQARRTVFLFSELRILVNVAAPRDQFALDLSGSLPDILLKNPAPPTARSASLNTTALLGAQAPRRNRFGGTCGAPSRAATSKKRP